jgi:hypothetical protein
VDFKKIIESQSIKERIYLLEKQISVGTRKLEQMNKSRQMKIMHSLRQHW